MLALGTLTLYNDARCLSQRGATMTNLTNVLELLREEQRQAQEQVQKLQGAISVIEGLVGLKNIE